MATQPTIMVDGKPYVLLPRAEYEKLTTLAKAAELPAFPAADADGNYPAVEYARASLARKIIKGRVGNERRGAASAVPAGVGAFSGVVGARKGVF